MRCGESFHFVVIPTDVDRGNKSFMSGRGKSLRPPGRQTKSARAGLHFPVGRIGRYLKQGRYSQRLALSAPIFLAAVLEYLCAEILELSGKAAKDNSRKKCVCVPFVKEGG